MSHWLNGLNPEQRKAALHDTGPLLILAGAGSGKTTVLVARTGRIIEEKVASAERVGVLTFTNKAGRELKTRLGAKLGKNAKGLWAGTFHSFGLQLLRKHHKAAKLPRDFGVIDATDAGGVAKELLSGFRQSGKKTYDEDRILSLLSRWRENGIAQATQDDEYETAVEWLLPRYLDRLDALGLVDFDGLLLKPLELMDSDNKIRSAIQSSYDQVMVDEFQDTNKIQMRFLKALVEPHRNLTVVGDDDQSIYAWRGACIANILEFPKIYRGCAVVRLERNYRSTPVILEIANAVIQKNPQRHPKALRPRETADRGELAELFVYDDENEECESVAHEISHFLREGRRASDIAVLYRSNGQGALLEAELRRLAIPYCMTGGTAFFDRKEVRDVLAYLRSATRPNEISLRRILNTPPRGLGDKTIEVLSLYAQTTGKSFLKAAREAPQAGIEGKAAEAIESLFRELDGLTAHLLAQPSAGAGLIGFLERLGYRRYLSQLAADPLTATKRWRYLELLGGVLDRFIERGGKTLQTIQDFLEAMELRDNAEDEEKEPKVQLLTLHACKGLEFPVVFLIGLEEDLLPHKKLGTDISEERRLFYVGVTRAKERLILTRAKTRRRHGRTVSSAPSRFLLEVPKHLFTEYDRSRPVREEARKAMLADLYKKWEQSP